MRQTSLNDQILLPTNVSNPFASMEESEKSNERKQMLDLLDQGLKRLHPKQYEALRLTILDPRGLSIRDVGMTNGIPYSTLRHRSKQGLRHLRKFLQHKKRSQESGARMEEKRED